MDKLKGMLKISERDKKLLLIVAAALIVVLAYFFGYQNLSSQADDLSSRKSKLEVTQRDLKEKNNNKDKYLADTTKLQTENRSALSRFDSGSTQPNTINFFIKTEGSNWSVGKESCSFTNNFYIQIRTGCIKQCKWWFSIFF